MTNSGYTVIHSIDGPPETIWMQTEGKRFRNAYIIKPAKLDFSPLLENCRSLVYMTDGVGDHVDSIREQVIAALESFDAEKDVIVPVGSAYVAFLSGQILRQKLADHPTWDSFAMGIFLNGTYYFWRIYTNPAKDSVRIE